MTLEPNEFTGHRRFSSENASALAAAGGELQPSRNSMQSKAIGAGKFPNVQKAKCGGTEIPTLAELLTDAELKHSLHRVVGFVSARRQSKRPQTNQGISRTKFASARHCHFGKEIRSKVIIFRHCGSSGRGA